MDNNKLPGEKEAVTSMVLGIISCATWVLGWTAIASIVLGIIGLVYANKAKEAGYEDNRRKAGFILSIIGLCGGGLVFISCFACAGCANAANIGALYGLDQLAQNI